MIILYVTEFFNPEMGYIENNLPRTYFELGHEVHIVATTKLPFNNMENSSIDKEEYRKKVSKINMVEGVIVHFLEHWNFLGYPILKGLGSLIRQIKPDIVQATSPITLISLQCAILKQYYGFKLFTMAHYTVSSFPLAQRTTKKKDLEHFKNYFTRYLVGSYISKKSEYCFSATVDCSYVATQFFGVSCDKIVLTPLCVDLRKYYPTDNDNLLETRIKLRSTLGFTNDDIVCVYTGKFTEGKNPYILAKSISVISKEFPEYKGLFIGGGPQEKIIKECKNCFVLPYVESSKLGSFYRASEIGVWPLQESVSMIDAAACGIPIIVNDKLQAIERLEGNGLMYKQNNVESLIECLLYLRSQPIRRQLGQVGVEKCRTMFNWNESAKLRISYYEKALTNEN